MRRIMALLLAVLVLTGCGMGSKSKTGPKGPPASGASAVTAARPDGAYLASIPCQDFEVTENGAVFVAAAGAMGAYVGTPSIWVLNFWSGLQGKHQQATVLVDSSGNVASESLPTTVDATGVPRTFSPDELPLEHLPVGVYHIVVLLDGEVAVSYPFVIAQPPGSGSSTRRNN